MRKSWINCRVDLNFGSSVREEGQAQALLNELRAHAELVPAMPEAQLCEAYEWGDVFIFPTIEDGFATVLAQAYAAGLPILATTNCGAPDFIRQGETGWILPIRAPAEFIEQLEWCDAHGPLSRKWSCVLRMSFNRERGIMSRRILSQPLHSASRTACRWRRRPIK